VRVVVADDSTLLREGIARLLAEHGFDVVGQAGSLDEIMSIVRRTVPDVAVLDIRMPPNQRDEGIVALRAIRAELGDQVGVLVLSQHVEPEVGRLVVEAGGGGLGYLLKDRVRDVHDFADAVTRVGHGEIVVDPAVVAELLRRPRTPPADALSDREREVLALMAEGRSNVAIAERLVVTERTIEAHIASIFSKLGLEPAAADHRRVLAVLSHLEGGSSRRS
jgi:DNA-binding NarL/FixJ family response regulator